MQNVYGRDCNFVGNEREPNDNTAQSNQAAKPFATTAPIQEGTRMSCRGRSSDSPPFQLPLSLLTRSSGNGNHLGGNECDLVEVASGSQRLDRPGISPEFPVHLSASGQSKSPRTRPSIVGDPSPVNDKIDQAVSSEFVKSSPSPAGPRHYGFP